MVGFGQNQNIANNKLHLNKRAFVVGDTIRVDFDLKDLMVMYSNFGGCGNGPIFEVICHSNPSLSQNSGPICDLHIEELTYVQNGNFHVIAHSPGVWSIAVYVKSKNQPQLYEDRFSQRITSKKFRVKQKK